MKKYYCNLYHNKAIQNEKQENYKVAEKYYKKILIMLPNKNLKKEIYFKLGDFNKMINYMDLNGKKLINIYKSDFENLESFLFCKQFIISHQGEEFKSGIEHNEYKSKNTSLKIKFNFNYDKNLYYILFSFLTIPNQKYLFSCWMKTDIVSGDIGFEVIDRRGYEIFCKPTRLLTGKNDWTLLRVEFETKNETKETLIRFRHYGNENRDSLLKGVVWIDDWELKRIE